MNTKDAPVVGSERRVLHKLARSTRQPGLDARNSLAEVFHENTKLGPLTSRAYATWIYNFSNSASARQTLHQSYKVYSLMERCELPRVDPRTELERTIAARRSVRTFSGAAIGLEELARLLLFSYGPTDPHGRLRAVASGGALYPLELYVVAFNVDGLERGIFHYGVETGHLDLVKPMESPAAFKDVVTWQGVDIDRAAAAIVITAAFRRTTVKYLDRGYRMVLMEAGEAAQNLSLMATSIGLGVCLLGGFHDDQLSDLLDIDGVGEAPLLPVLVGRPPTTARSDAEGLSANFATEGDRGARALAIQANDRQREGRDDRHDTTLPARRPAGAHAPEVHLHRGDPHARCRCKPVHGHARDALWRDAAADRLRR